MSSFNFGTRTERTQLAIAPERGCVGDQPQRLRLVPPIGLAWNHAGSGYVLRLVLRTQPRSGRYRF